MMSLVLSLSAFAFLSPLSGSPSSELPQVENFVLTSSAGEKVALWTAGERPRGTVLTFFSVECPISKVYGPRYAELAEMYAEEGIRFLGVDPNIQDSAEEIQGRAEAVGIEYPIAQDPFQVVTDRLGVTRTTEVFLLDADYRLLYRGALDDQYGVGTQKDSADEEYLASAIEALLAGEEVEVPQTDAPGCLIGRVQDAGDDLSVTFHRDVVPILNEHCVECHRPGQIGPMELLDYKEVKGWGPMISEVIGNGRMPPWHADPRYGHFRNSRGLTDTEKALIDHWVRAGAPEGDPSDAPEPPTYQDEGWAIGEPDIIIDLPEPQEIPAEGTIPYRYVEVDPQIEEDLWIQAMEIRPTAPEVTHHVLVLLLPPGDDFGSLTRRGDTGFVGQGYFAVNVPGARPNVFNPETAKFLPAGSRLIFQLHYTANGVEAIDQCRMALKLADGPPEKEVRTSGLANVALNIPPGEMATYTAEREIKKAMRLVSIFPHMHTRGHAFKVEVQSGSERRTILDIPKYDFNWQNFYRLSEPMLLGVGDKMIATAVYDNTEDNPFNPDPTDRVFWGDQTWEEMFIAYYDYIELD